VIAISNPGDEDITLPSTSTVVSLLLSSFFFLELGNFRILIITYFNFCCDSSHKNLFLLLLSSSALFLAVIDLASICSTSEMHSVISSL
jgi:hypothetical protein